MNELLGASAAPRCRMRTPNVDRNVRTVGVCIGFSEHVKEAATLNDAPPLSPPERRRRVLQLCRSFMRNLAFRRAWRDNEVQRALFETAHPQAAFWREVHGNFFDISVLCTIGALHSGAREHFLQRRDRQPSGLK
jgi:hypothetical protein